MNHFVPDWSNMGDTSRVLGEDDELIELLWRNGHVVMQSQTNRRPPRPEKAAAGIQEDEAATWSPYALADSLERDLFEELFYDVPAAAVDADKSSKEDAAAGGQKHGGAGAATGAQQDLMPPPKLTHAAGCGQQQTASLPDGKNAGDLSDLVRSRTVGSEKAPAKEPMESSMLSTIGSSFCGSNQVPMQRAVSTPGRTGASDTAFGSTLPWAGGNETTVASSSGRSNYCYSEAEPPGASDQRGKRKRRDTEESKSPSEDAEFESAAACKPPQKLTTARRSRAAEVHNLSERRRRDRINEKMRALQELIPHCNKTDKASMLDEAIEYLKTLQLQLQMMWMGSGMAPPMMFPGIHQYIPQMGIGMSTPTPSMPRMPFMPQPVVPNPPVSSVPLCAAGNHNPSNFGNHMPSVSLPEPYAHYLGVNHLQPPSQGLSFYPLGAKTVQQNLVPALPSGSLPSATTGAQTSGNTPTKKSG